MKYDDFSIYHVFNRGAHRSNIFMSDQDYESCLELVQIYAHRYNVAVLAYCLMPNHYHFLLRQKQGGSISRLVQTTFNAYSQSVNRSTGHSGTMFEGRAKGRLIDSDAYLARVVRYIHLNPLRARLATTPAAWKFSDYRVWIGETKGLFGQESVLLQYFESGRDYATFVDECPEEADRLMIARYL